MPAYLTLILSDQDVREAVGEGILEQFLDLDRFLVRLSESRLFRSIVVHPRTGGTLDMVDCIGSLFPEMMWRGMFGSIHLNVSTVAIVSG